MVRVHMGGSFCPYDLHQLADPTRPPLRHKSTQNVARIPNSIWVGLIHAKACQSLSLSAYLVSSTQTVITFFGP